MRRRTILPPQCRYCDQPAVAAWESYGDPPWVSIMACKDHQARAKQYVEEWEAGAHA